MKISREWLGDYIDLTGLDDDTVSRRLTEIGHAVDSVEQVDGDTVFDIEFTSNRVDAMSHLGLARELGAAFGRDLRPPAPQRGTTGESAIELTIEVPELCSRYTALKIDGVKVQPSNPKVRKRLDAVGHRPINNIVDAGNYVMLATGHPLHAFDADRLRGGRIIVRRGGAVEPIRCLDGETRKADHDTVVIADGVAGVGLGGIIGGAESEIREETRNVLLECAWFEPAAIRKTARRLGIRTDASYRYERRVDPCDTIATALLAASHIVREAGGMARAPREVVAREIAPQTLTLRTAALHDASGGHVGIDYALETLRRLGMDCEPFADGIQVFVPTWRGDIHEEIDLIEEVVRFFGFNNIAPVLPRLTTGDVRSDVITETEETVRDVLMGCGLSEAITYAFVHPSWNALFSDEEPLAIDNALTENISSMRLSAIPGLIEAAVYNRGYGNRDGSLFEVGRTYHRDGEGIIERPVASFVLFGSSPGHWGDPRRPFDFFDARGILEALCERFHVEPEVQPHARTWFRDGQGALATVGSRELARFGSVSREVLQQLGVKGELFAAEIDLTVLATGGAAWAMTDVSRYPGVPMVVGLLHRRDLPYASLIAEVKRMRLPLVHEVGIRDRYQPDASIDEVKTTLGIWYQASDRSLTQEEVAEVHAKVIEGLAAALPVKIVAS